MQTLLVALSLSGAAALAPQQQQTTAKKTLDRRSMGTGLMGAVGAFTAQTASAAAGESPKFSFFGILGNADTYSEGAAYGMDQGDPTYSPYSPYGKVGDGLYKKYNADAIAYNKRVFAESSKRCAKVESYIKAKKWEEVRSELERYVYNMRGSMNVLADVSGKPEAKDAAKKFYQQMETVNVLCKRKNQDAALAAYGSMMASLDAYSKLI